VGAVNYEEQCSTFAPGTDTLQADWVMVRTAASDSIFLSTDTVSPGDTAEIIVNIGNPDSAVAAMTLWLKPETTLITFDTVAPVSPRFPVSGMDWKSVDHAAENIVSLLFVDFQSQEYIPPGSGPVLKYFFAVDPSTPPGTYAINSEAIAGILRSYELSYRSGLGMPEVLFIPGAIVVQ